MGCPVVHQIADVTYPHRCGLPTSMWPTHIDVAYPHRCGLPTSMWSRVELGLEFSAERPPRLVTIALSSTFNVGLLRNCTLPGTGKLCASTIVVGSVWLSPCSPCLTICSKKW